MTLSREVPRFVLPGVALSALVFATCAAGPLAAAPGFAPVRPAFFGGPRPVVASRVRPGVRGDGDLRRGRRAGDGRFGGAGIGVGILPLVPPIEAAVAAPASQDYGPVGRSDERWAWEEQPQRAACIRPLIIDLRAAPKTRPTVPHVIYGTAPPVCPRS